MSVAITLPPEDLHADLAAFFAREYPVMTMKDASRWPSPTSWRQSQN
jgi:hypothetical protein